MYMYLYVTQKGAIVSRIRYNRCKSHHRAVPKVLTDRLIKTYLAVVEYATGTIASFVFI